jgi:hypothetical protein
MAMIAIINKTCNKDTLYSRCAVDTTYTDGVSAGFAGAKTCHATDNLEYRVSFSCVSVICITYGEQFMK